MKERKKSIIRVITVVIRCCHHVVYFFEGRSVIKISLADE